MVLLQLQPNTLTNISLYPSLVSQLFQHELNVKKKCRGNYIFALYLH